MKMRIFNEYIWKPVYCCHRGTRYRSCLFTGDDVLSSFVGSCDGCYWRWYEAALGCSRNKNAWL